MKITACVGSSCHLKGSRQVILKIQELIRENHLEDKVEFAGTFCMGKCQQGVCVMRDDEFFSVTPESTKEFFEENILKKL